MLQSREVQLNPDVFAALRMGTREQGARTKSVVPLWGFKMTEWL
jgi:hypothetical protein